jgi:hypothetical protein
MRFIEARDSQGHIAGVVAVPEGRGPRNSNYYTTWTCLAEPHYGSAIRATNSEEAIAMLGQHIQEAHRR